MGVSASQQVAPEEQAKKNRQRREVVNEIVQTEESYASCLNIVVRVFLTPLEEAVQHGKPIITQEEITAVFANIKDIQQLHANLIGELRVALPGAENGPFANVLAKYIVSFKMYTEYVNNYNNSLETLSRCQKKKKAFQMFLADANRDAECRGRDLPTLLINPIQRLPRYILLLQELQKLTPSRHKDYKNIGRALADVKQMTEFINSEKKQAEMSQKLLEIQESFVDDISLLAKQRQLMQEGDFNYRRKNKKGFKPDMHFFLFNDMLLLARPRSAVGRVSSLIGGSGACWKMSAYAPLSQVEVQDVPDSKDEQFCIIVLVGGKDYVVKFGTQQEKESCMSLFFTTKSKSHRITFWDIVTVSSSSRGVHVSPRPESIMNKGKEKEAKKDKEKKKEKKDKKGKKGKKDDTPPDAISSIMSAFSSLSHSLSLTEDSTKSKRKGKK